VGRGSIFFIWTIRSSWITITSKNWIVEVHSEIRNEGKRSVRWWCYQKLWFVREQDRDT
jgi:hypothetical protein